MFVIVKEVKSILQSAAFYDAFEIAPLTWLLLFSKGIPNAFQKLLICTKRSEMRFYLASRSYAGRTTPFTRELIKGLKGQQLVDLLLVNEDRILLLQFSEGSQLVFEFFPGGKSFLTKNYLPPERTFEHQVDPSSCTSSVLETAYLEEKEAEWKAKWRKKIEERIVHFQKEIEEGKRWSIKQHEAELLQANLYRIKRGTKEITIEDWEKGGMPIIIVLNGGKEPHEEVGRRFKEARKLKKKLEIAERLLEKALQELNQPAPPLPSAFPEKRPRLPPAKSLPYREYTSESGLKILVGKKDRDNDLLTFTIAQGNDYWFHAGDVAGSHVVLRVKKGEDPDPAAIQDALQLALHYSKARGKKADVVMTQCKYLAKAKGAKAGLVNLSQHKTVYVAPNALILHRFGIIS
jgi:predicted ribosome quality control (RQC) complex YloA/Tae2 family protein